MPLQSLLTTVVHRPYVFLFLASFLVIAILNRGLSRTLLFLILGYLVAFLSEFSSIRNGFPYGLYHYVYENLRGELLLGGVPVWDSLSYVFIAYSAYEMAHWIQAKSEIRSTKFETNPRFKCFNDQNRLNFGFWSLEFVWYLVLRIWNLALPPILMTLLDVVIDPLAVRGDRWFLGKIFYYPEGGIYFGVPLSNFAGWLLVALVIFGSYRFLEKRLCKKPPPLRAPVLGPLFYFGILFYNLAITFWIGEFRLGFVGLAIAATPVVVLSKILQSSHDPRFLDRP